MFTDFERHRTVIARLWTMISTWNWFLDLPAFCGPLKTKNVRMFTCFGQWASSIYFNDWKNIICVWIFSPLHPLSPLDNISFCNKFKRSLCIVLLFPCFPQNVRWPNCIFLRNNHALMGAFEQLICQKCYVCYVPSEFIHVRETYFWSVIQRFNLFNKTALFVRNRSTTLYSL